MTEAMVTPEVLSWARQRRGLEVSAFASKLNVKPEAVAAWETGDRRPTFRQAQRSAQILRVPFGYLFLSEPPIENSAVPDVRTVSSRVPRESSPEFLDLFNDVLVKQQWFREYREAEGMESLPFVGRFNLEPLRALAGTTGTEAVAADISRTIDTDVAIRQSANQEEFLRELTRNAEGTGIMVMRSSVVGNNVHRPLDPKEFRGFALPDEIAPLIFVNVRELIADQVFTFAHELSHVWMGEGGICSPTYSKNSEELDYSVEQFCDRVAQELLGRLMNYQEGLGPLPMGNSPWVEERRAAGSGELDQANERGGAFCQILMARNGTAFTEAVISSAAEGTLLSREAANLLGVKVRTLPSIANHIFGSTLNLA